MPPLALHAARGAPPARQAAACRPRRCAALGAPRPRHPPRRAAPARAAVAEPPPPPTTGVLSPIQLWHDPARPADVPPKRLQTQVAPIAADTTVIRSLDMDRDRFDIEFGLSDGTTYNSYVIRGADKVALVDASHAKFNAAYIEALRSVVDPATIDYIVVSHTEPDHSGLVEPLLALAPRATVVGAKVCLQFLANLVHAPFEKMEVKGGSTIDLGGGHVLEFVPAPNLHWPDTMFSYDRGTGVMYTCDAFGMHYCSEEVFDASLAPLEAHFRFYYDCLMRPNARSVLTALRKVAELPFSTIAVGHGPVLRYNVPELVGRYASWSTDALAKAAASVCVLYTADYGFADRLSQAAARGLTKTDVEVAMVDLGTAEAQEVIEALGRAAGVVLLAPPASGRAHDALAAVFAAVSSKQRVLIAESYGGADEPVDTLAASLLSAGAQLAAPPLRVKDTPSEGTYQLYEESGTDLGQAITAKQAMAAMKAAMSPAVAKALGRISGGLYLVTAARGDARSAMIASWVAQASFEPLGFTVAVAKDRAIESLMQVGDRFVLNCLPETDTVPLMKHFLKRFPPGADRFEGVDWTPSSCGSPILSAAVAYMECVVSSRMEGGDHWVVLATVSNGGVMRPDVRTAVHHRKVGSYY